jgi:hypothetical protein
MKHLKSTLDDLHYIFDCSISVRTVAEPLASFDDSRQADEVQAFMAAKDYDVVGLRRNGLVAGYVSRAVLPGAILSDHLMPFEVDIQFDEAAPLLEALLALERSPQIFVTVMGQVWGIVTKGDLQKAPIRMWLFGVLSLVEMQFLRLIRASFPGDSWKSKISPKRVRTAHGLFQKRQRRNEAIDLADCLQFADKRAIISKTQNLRSGLGFRSCKKAEKALKELEELRNDLAHAQDIVTSRWPRLVELAKTAECILSKCEKLVVADNKPA